VQQLLDRESIRAQPSDIGGLQVTLTDAPDNFLRVARQTLQLEIGEVEVCEVLPKTTSP
jgi:hypothetical protein